MPEMMPPASLESRDTDVALLSGQFLKIAFFAPLTRVPDLDKYPGSLILRRFRKGQVICQQGAAGWSAFYTLGDADALKVLQQKKNDVATLRELRAKAGSGEDPEPILRQINQMLAPDALKSLEKKLQDWKKKKEQFQARIKQLETAQPSSKDQQDALKVLQDKLAEWDKEREKILEELKKGQAEEFPDIEQMEKMRDLRERLQEGDEGRERILSVFRRLVKNAGPEQAVAFLTLLEKRQAGELERERIQAELVQLPLLPEEVLREKRVAARRASQLPSSSDLELLEEKQLAWMKKQEQSLMEIDLIQEEEAIDRDPSEMLLKLQQQMESGEEETKRIQLEIKQLLIRDIQELQQGRLAALAKERGQFQADCNKQMDEALKRLQASPAGAGTATAAPEVIGDLMETARAMVQLKSKEWNGEKERLRAEMLKLSEGTLAAIPQILARWEDEKQQVQAEIRRMEQTAASPNQEAATVYLDVRRRSGADEPGLLGRLGRMVFGDRKETQKRSPQFVPIDGPTDIRYDTRQGSINDGDLFGEMSCQQGTPRSVTVVASRDLYVLEMLRNILDEVKRDDKFRKRMDDIYKNRVLQLHLSGLSFFKDLTEAEQEQLQKNVELLHFKDGDLICDQNDRSDSMFLVRGGLVKVVRNVSALLAVGEVEDWGQLVGHLQKASQAAAKEPAGVLWSLLPQATRDLVTKEAPALTAKLPQRDKQQEVVYGLNELIKNPKLPDLKELKPLLDNPTLAARRKELPPATAKWAPLELRQFNRQVLEDAWPGALSCWMRNQGPETILAYLGRGEYLGEMGVVLKKPRTASCVAYVHPLPGGATQAVWQREGDLVEMVRIPAQTFQQLMQANSALRSRIEREMAQRMQNAGQRMRERTWDDQRLMLHSDDFSNLGLVQGQRLMLIDLDRCTRCDECVKACVHSHSDGRSRLFLDGPRFGKYLVPTTCRSCLNPVCMIGCPVGAIHRGGNREMIIEDWCIGCGLCERNCPYGSIQMHDIGLVHSEARDWHFLPLEGVRDASWTSLNYRDYHWLIGKAPFFNDRDLADQLQSVRGRPGQDVMGSQSICFRREFQVNRNTLEEVKEYTLEITSIDENALVWINGAEIRTQEEARRGVRNFAFSREDVKLRPGRNVVAVQVKVPADKVGTAFDLRLDEVRLPDLPLGVVGDYTEKSYGKFAVVCDLCSDQYGQRPACVNACPHDAALRVDARFEFPEQ